MQQIQGDHIPRNKFELVVVGLPKITFTTVSSITDATTETTLPDGTSASGGKTTPKEFTVTVPAHHLVQVAAMDNWKRQGEDPVDQGYKKAGTLIGYTGTGNAFKSWSLSGLWCRDRVTPDFDMDDDGEMAVVTYLMKADKALPV